MGNQGLIHNPGGEDTIQRVIPKTLCTLDAQRVVGSTEKWELKPDCREMRDGSTPGLPVYHQLQEFTQTHVGQVGDAI